MTTIRKIFRAGFTLGLASILLAGQARSSGLAQERPRPLSVLVLLGPKGGGPPPGDGFESAPIQEICDAVAREITSIKRPAAANAGEIHAAVRAGDLARVKALVAQDPKVVNEKDARGRTPLHYASGAGNAEIVKFLLASGAAVKATDPDGFTPLHWAASEGKADAARVLIAAGADPNARSAQGEDTLESAFYGRHPEAVEALLQGGLKVETKGDEGRVLLHRAAAAGFLSLVEYLLKNGADVNALSEEGSTPLLYVTLAGREDVIIWLVEHGARLDAHKDDMAYLLKKAGKVNLAFIGKFQQAEWLKPRVVFPIHAGGWEYMYGAFARKAAAMKLPSRVILPENNGDRFIFPVPEGR